MTQPNASQQNTSQPNTGQTAPTVEFRPLRPGLIAGARQELTVQLLIHPAPAPQRRGERLPLNLALVIDRSGSMSGEPLEMAREAIVAALRQLQPQDRVSVVSFDDEVRVEVPSGPVLDLNAMIAQVMQIRSGGRTALYDGWMEGATQVAGHLNQEGLNRVILLSDGQANHGLTDAREIARHVRGLAERGVSTTTLGFGRSYDETLLLGMASAGDGNFEHIETAGSLPTFFESELQGLTRTSGRTVSLGLEPNPEYGAQVLETLNDLTLNTLGRYQLGNLVEGQPVSVVVKLQLTAPAPGHAPLGVTRVRLAWTGLDGVRRKVRAQLNLPVLSQAEYDALPDDPQVIEAALLLSMARTQTLAVQAMDRGDRGMATSYFSDVVGMAQSMPSPSVEMTATLLESQDLQRLYDGGDDLMARKRAVSQSHGRSQSKPRK